MAYAVHAKRRLVDGSSFLILGHDMNGQAPFRIYFSDGEHVARMAGQALRAVGMTVVRSFDLRSACAPRPDLACPHHEGTPCDCQLMVLLVYIRSADPPISLVLHSHQARTELHWDGIAGNSQQTGLKALILDALDSYEDRPVFREKEDLPE